MKFFIFLVVLGLVSWSYFETNEFTYLNGKLSSGATATFNAVSLIILVILFLNMFIGFVKRKVENEHIDPFED